MHEERLIQIESKISEQEFLLEQLNQVLCRQQETVDRLEMTIKSLVKRLKDAGLNEEDIGPANEKPPHY